MVQSTGSEGQAATKHLLGQAEIDKFQHEGELKWLWQASQRSFYPQKTRERCSVQGIWSLKISQHLKNALH